MYTHVKVHAGTIEKNIQAKPEISTCRVLGLEIKAHLEAWLAISHMAGVYTPCFSYRLNILIYLIRLCLRGVCHGIEKGGIEVDQKFP